MSEEVENKHARLEAGTDDDHDGAGPADVRDMSPDAADGAEFIVDEATDEVLRIHLDKFEGPFEVLLYLIKAQEIDIFDIPIAKVTEQYLRFLELMREQNLDVVGEFLVLAATLIQIKAKMVVPPEMDEDDEEAEEEDPRLELVEKLLEYRRYRDVAARLQWLEEQRVNCFSRKVKPKVDAGAGDDDEYLEVSLYDLTQAVKGVMRFLIERTPHTVTGENYSVDDKIDRIKDVLAERVSVSWYELFKECKSRVELACCFLAVLELCRMGRVRAHQHKVFGDIRLFETAADTSG